MLTVYARKETMLHIVYLERHGNELTLPNKSTLIVLDSKNL